LLDEDDDEDEDRDLGEHRSGPRLEQLVDDPEAHRRVDGTGHLSDAPDPSPNAYMSTRLVGTPSALAIGRFCVTPRTNSPSRVRLSSSAMSMTTAAAKTMMAMRFHGSTRFVMSSTPPDIQLGFSTCTFCAPKSVRID